MTIQETTVTKPPGSRPGLLLRGIRRLDPVLLVVLLIGTLFVLLNLSNRYLWTDEAETACLAKNILQFGLPKAFDGVNYVSQWEVAQREDFNEDSVWVLSPWLQLYVAAGSFGLLGTTTFAARLPFALLGLVNLWMIYVLALRVFGDRRIARLAAVLLLVCVPFLLHARQARYYTLSMLFTMGAIHAYVGLLEKRRSAHLWLLLFGSLLFHSNYGLLVPVAGALGLHALLLARRKLPWTGVMVALLGIAALTVPWAVYTNILRTGSVMTGRYYAFNALNYLICINHYFLPLLLPLAFAGLAGLLRWDRKHLVLKNPGLSAILLVVVLNVAFVATNRAYLFRYIIVSVPLLVLLNAAHLLWFVDTARDRLGGKAGRWAAGILIPVAMFTTLLSQPVFPVLFGLEKASPRNPPMDQPGLRRPRDYYKKLTSDIFDFLGEITSDYNGPNEGIIEYLRAHAHPDDIVFTRYGDLPLIFYTDLAVRGGRQGTPYLGEPEWIIDRPFRTSPILRRYAVSQGYRRIELPHADNHWENRPAPSAHKFETAKITRGGLVGIDGYPPVVVFAHPKIAGRKATAPQEDTRHGKHLRREEGPPNVLLITMDCLRADRIAKWQKFYASPPHISRLGSESATFSRCYTTSPGTAPAAASLLTGLFPRDLGHPAMNRGILPDTPTLASILRQAGFRTGAFVSTASLDRGLGLHGGFDTYLGPSSARQEDFEVARAARQWLLSRDEGRKPWLAWVHFNGAHGPYRNTAIRGLAFDSLRHLSTQTLPGAPDNRRLPILDSDSRRNGIPAYQRVDDTWPVSRYRNFHSIQALLSDWYVMELRRTLQVIEAEDRTIIIVIGTHGESLGEDHIYFDHGEDLSNATLHVPLVIHVPGQTPFTDDQPVSSVDVLPTVLSLLDLPTPEGSRGYDLFGSDRMSRIGVFSQVYPPIGARTIAAMTGVHWRLLQSETTAIEYVGAASERERLRDSRERETLADRLRKELTSLLDDPVGPSRDLQMNPRRQRRIQALGYVLSRHK